MSSASTRRHGSRNRRVGTMVATLASLVVVVGLALSACSPGDSAVSQEDSGSEVSIAVGSTLEVALDSDLSIEYVWLVAEADPEVLIQAGETSFEPESDEEGAAGVETFYFEGVGAGTTSLKLEYLDPAELADPERTFELVVNVE